MGAVGMKFNFGTIQFQSAMVSSRAVNPEVRLRMECNYGARLIGGNAMRYEL